MSRPTKQDLKRFWHYPVGWMFLGKNRPETETMGFYHGVLPSNVGVPSEFPAIFQDVESINIWLLIEQLTDMLVSWTFLGLNILKTHVRQPTRPVIDVNGWIEWKHLEETVTKIPSLTRNTEASHPRARIIQKISETKNPAKKNNMATT